VLQDFLGTALKAVTAPSCVRRHRGYSSNTGILGFTSPSEILEAPATAMMKERRRM
jgi:hypothetical protein